MSAFTQQAATIKQGVPAPARPVARIGRCHKPARVTKLFAFCCIVTAGIAASSQIPTTVKNGPRVLEAIRDVRQLGANAGDTPIPVHVRAVVTYYDSAVPNLFVQDTTGGIWVDLRGRKDEPPRPGQVLDLQGVAAKGFAPYIAEPHWTVVGRAGPPNPIPLTYEKAQTGSFDAQWVQMDGIVRSFVQQSEGNILIIDVATPAGSYKVRIPDYRAGFPLYLVDAEVRFRGVCSSDFNTRNQLISMHLMVPTLDDISVLQPAPPDPFSVPAVQVNSIRRFSGDLPDVHRVKVKGTVTARFSGQGLFLMDKTGGVWVDSSDGAPVKPGDEVEVIGFPAAGDYSPVLKSGGIRPTGHSTVLIPTPITGRSALQGPFDAQLIAMEGVFHSYHHRKNDLYLDMESIDHTSFEAILRNRSEPPFSLAAGSRLAVTGICTVKADENGNPTDFEVVLRDASDIRVISSPPWLNGRRALYTLVALAALVLTVFAWVGVLRRRVQQQTRIIQLKLESEATLEARYRRVFERNIAGLFIAELDGRLIDCNEACAQILGFASRRDLLDHRAAADRILHPFCHAATEADPIVNAEHRFQRRDGVLAWALANSRVVQQADGHSVVEGALVDITDRKLADERVEFLAYFDPLTGLPNRTLLQDRLSKALAVAKRHKDRVAVLFLDVDRFKNINDSLGHSYGDLLLQKIARRLEMRAREQDTVARLGGDEFLIVLGSIKVPSEAGIVAERICRDMCAGFEVQGQVLNVSCSVGISIYPENGNDAEALIKNADAAMYSSKEDGRNTFRYFNEQMTEQAVERLMIENSLRSALEHQQFFLVFQPEIDLASGGIVCCETLLRWKHPTLGLVRPDRFIPIAESTGAIIAIGEWVLYEACKEAKRWQEITAAPLPVAVNVSSTQLYQPGFCDTVRMVLQETGLPATLLELELTESVLASHQDLIAAVFKELRSMGVSIAIDDFGTGYSGLSYLKQFPVTKLKIDRSFIREVDKQHDDAAITSAIIQMAQRLSIRVTAEGVETEGQLSRLRAMRCDQVQGFLLSEPLTVEQVESRIRENSLRTSLAESLEEFADGIPGVESWPT